MFERLTQRARRLAAVTAAGALVVTGLAIPIVNASPAAADNLTVATVTAAPVSPAFSGQVTNGMTDGQSVKITADATGSERIPTIQARLCRDGVNIEFDADFNPSQGGNCIQSALSANSDATIIANGTPGSAPVHAELTFRVGTGTNTFTRQNGQSTTITCDSSNPCALWVKVSSQSTTAQYKHFTVTYAGTPDAPTNVQAAVGAGQATVTWTAPTNTGNAPVSSYTVTYTPDGGSPSTVSATGTSKTITGLTNFVNYTFSVQANTIGSFVSAASSTATGSPAPGGPSALGGVPAGGGVGLSWTAPTSPGVTDYRVSYTPAGGSASYVLTGSTGVTYNLTGLTNGTAYTISIQAVYGGTNYTTPSNVINVTPTAAVVGDSFVVVVPNGSLALTTAATGAINLGTAVLDSTARFWESTGQLSEVTVVDTRGGASGWSLSIVAGNFTSGANSFTGANLGVTPTIKAGYTTDLSPVAGATVAPRGGSGNAGLSVSRTFANSAATANTGKASIGGDLKLSVPTSQAPGTYSGTLTITAL